MNCFRIGLLGNNRGWKVILDQEGVPYASVSEPFSPDEFSAIVVSNGVDEQGVSSLRNYLKAGGAVLCSGAVFSQVSGTPSREKYIRYVYPEATSDFSGIGLVDVFTMCDIPDNATTIRNEHDENVAYVGELGGGHIVVLPFDAGEIVLDRRVATKSFYARRSRLPFERVSLVAKNGVRKLVARSLELLHHRRGRPYVHKWYFPCASRSLFALRIDTDLSGQSEIERLYETLRPYGVPLTWFVDVKSQEGCIDSYRKMEGHEIGIHCYTHETYNDYARNVENIRKAADVFEKHGLKARSFAAPYGDWNDGIARAIEHGGFEYSSEFSYDSDNLPSFPSSSGENRWRSLQIPIHPISIGSLRRQGFSEREMMDYFRGVIEDKLRQRDPLFFYHHPANDHENVLKDMLDFVREKNVQAVRMIDYALWWKKRNELSTEIESEGNLMKVNTLSPGDGVLLHIIRGDGYESFVQVQPRVELGSLDWSECPRLSALPLDAARTRQFNPWIPINRFEDFIRKVFKA